jgi:hypothetical protein
VIPRGVRFIDGTAFRDVELSSLSIENGNDRFVIRGTFLIDIVDHKLIRNFSNSPSVPIPRDIKILGSCQYVRHTIRQTKLFFLPASSITLVDWWGMAGFVPVRFTKNEISTQSSDCPSLYVDYSSPRCLFVLG